MEYLSDVEFSNLSQMVKPCTWVIQVTHQANMRKAKSYGTGFAISLGENRTVLLTCAHVVNKAKCILVRKIDDQDFMLKAEIAHIKLTWDIALLVVEGVANDIYAKFVDDGSILPCQTLIHVGHSFDFVWSVFVGRAVYQCVDDFVPIGTRDTCEDYECSTLKTTPGYRIMGHVWNKTYFDNNESMKFPFEKNLSPHIPIIQCAGFCCRDGCSGGPVFNCRGEIVGMIVGEFDGSQIAIHVTLLKYFVRQYLTPDSSQAGSSQSSRQLKRKGSYK